jgi:hypothetical protein
VNISFTLQQKPEITHDALLLGITFQKKLVFSNMTVRTSKYAGHYFVMCHWFHSNLFSLMSFQNSSVLPQDLLRLERDAQSRIILGADIVATTLSSCFNNQMETVFNM